MDFYSVASSRPFTLGQISWWVKGKYLCLISKFKPKTLEKNLSLSICFPDEPTPSAMAVQGSGYEATEAAYQTKRNLCVFRAEMSDSRLRVDQL